MPTKGHSQDIPCLYYQEHAGQAHPLHCMGQGPSLPAPLWQVMLHHELAVADNPCVIIRAALEPLQGLRLNLGIVHLLQIPQGASVLVQKA